MNAYMNRPEARLKRYRS